MLRPSTIFKSGLMAAVLLVTLQADLRAQEGARESIEKIYSKRYQSAEMLHLHGMRHGRSDDFMSFDPNGEKVDMEQFYKNWASLMTQILKAKWQGKILELEWLGEEKVKCKVADRFDAVLRDSRYATRSHVVTVSVSEDLWEYRNGNWIQTSSRVLEQKQGRNPLTDVANGEKENGVKSEPATPEGVE